MSDIYETCPQYMGKTILLRQTEDEDLNDLLKVYSDQNAVPIFNSDNCHGDDFNYTTLERMKEAIDFWNFSYQNRYFVRWSVIDTSIGEAIGTVEMFHRVAEDEFNHYGVMRLDLRSDYEKMEIINEILDVANEHFYEAFHVEVILTKAIPNAKNRIASLEEYGYRPLNRKLMIYDDYYSR